MIAAVDLRCPLFRLEPFEPDLGPTNTVVRSYALKPCDAELYVVPSAAIPVDGSLAAHVDLRLEDGVTTAWRVECTEGHVLLCSSEPEHAEPYSPALVRGLVDAINAGPFPGVYRLQHEAGL